MSAKESKYLIRSAREILGPYNKEEVIDLIKKGKISTFDEVTEPFEIWMALLDHKEFKPVVQSIDMQTRITNFLTDISSKITKTKKSPTQSQTLSQTETEKISAPKPTLSQKEKESASEVEFDVLKPSSPRGKKRLKPYSSRAENEEKVRQKIGFFVRLSWRMIIASALLVLSFIAYQVIYKPLQEKQAILQELELTGMSLYQKGDYLASFPYFKKARELNLLNEKQKLLYSGLLLKQNKNQQAYLLKNELSGSNILNSGEGLLLSALMDFYDEDYAQANSSLQKLLSTNPKPDLKHKALINLAILNWKQKKYSQSTAFLEQLLNYERNIAWYLKALNFLYQKKWAELENYIKNELFFQPGTKPVVVEFKQEFLLMLAYLEMKKNNSESLNNYILQFFNQDPLMYHNYSYHPLIAANSLNWGLLFSYCREIFNFNPNEKLLQALYAFCFFKRDQFDNADRELTRLISAEPQNPLFLSLQAYFLMDREQEQSEEIAQILSLIDERDLRGDKLLLPLIIKAYFLQSQMDREGSSRLWKKLLDQDPKHLSALAGMAINSYQLQEEGKGEFYLKQALGSYPYHKKLLQYEK